MNPGRTQPLRKQHGRCNTARVCDTTGVISMLMCPEHTAPTYLSSMSPRSAHTTVFGHSLHRISECSPQTSSQQPQQHQTQQQQKQQDPLARLVASGPFVDRE
ncbi:unnamed protein product, partial [Polarella glacialis]